MYKEWLDFENLPSFESYNVIASKAISVGTKLEEVHENKPSQT